MTRTSPTAEMHLDLSDLPPLITPSPPSNTLLITQLTNPSIFLPSTLTQLKSLLSHHANSPIHTFSPLKSMRRIIISFPTTEAATTLRRILDGEEIHGCRVRVYFGVATPVRTPPPSFSMLSNGNGEEERIEWERLREEEDKKRFLAAPDAGKLFFISPPPSPPAGWTMRNEDPPNKMVHAQDLVSALARVSSGGGAVAGMRNWEGKQDEEDDDEDEDMLPSPLSARTNTTELQQQGDGVAAADMMDEEADVSAEEIAARRSGLAANTTLVYHPDDHGGSGFNLPAVMVEDVSEDGQARLDAEGKRILTHTARPPVELMVEAEGNQDMDMDVS